MLTRKVYLIRHKRSLRYYNGKRERWWGDLSQAKIYPRIGVAKTAITCHTKAKWLDSDVELVEAELRVVENVRPRFTCPECNRDTDGNAHLPCEMVYGRRGWRRLGDYDS